MDEDFDLAGISSEDLRDLDLSLDIIASGHTASTDIPIETVRGLERCTHGQGLLHPGVRKLTCRDCGCDLDAYDFLLRLSSDPTRHRNAAARAEEDADKAQARLNSLLREERNAKARRRRRIKKP